jgi:hypothetical protein
MAVVVLCGVPRAHAARNDRSRTAELRHHHGARPQASDTSNPANVVVPAYHDPRSQPSTVIDDFPKVLVINDKRLG